MATQGQRLRLAVTVEELDCYVRDEEWRDELLAALVAECGPMREDVPVAEATYWSGRYGADPWGCIHQPTEEERAARARVAADAARERRDAEAREAARIRKRVEAEAAARAARVNARADRAAARALAEMARARKRADEWALQHDLARAARLAAEAAEIEVRNTPVDPCHVHGCTHLVASGMRMCERCWGLVPKPIRDAALNAFRTCGEAEYQAAATACIEEARRLLAIRGT